MRVVIEDTDCRHTIDPVQYQLQQINARLATIEEILMASTAQTAELVTLVTEVSASASDIAGGLASLEGEVDALAERLNVDDPEVAGALDTLRTSITELRGSADRVDSQTSELEGIARSDAGEPPVDEEPPAEPVDEGGVPAEPVDTGDVPVNTEGDLEGIPTTDDNVPGEATVPNAEETSPVFPGGGDEGADQ